MRRQLTAYLSEEEFHRLREKVRTGLRRAKRPAKSEQMNFSGRGAGREQYS